MNEPKQKFDIFLSYRREHGIKDAMLLKNALEDRGYSVFLDLNSLQAGQFDEQLYQRIDECTDFIVVLPPNALDRCVNEDDWVRMEIERAHAGNKNIIPIMLEGFFFPDELPESIDFIRRTHGLKPSFDYFDAFIDKLVRFLKSEPTSSPASLNEKRAYQEAMSKQQSAKTASDYQQAIELFEKCGDYLDSKANIRQCSDNIRKLHRRRNLSFAAIGLIVLAVFAGLFKWKATPTPNPVISPEPVAPVQTDTPDKSVFQPGIDNVLMSDICDDRAETAADAFLFRSDIKRSQIRSITFLDSLEQKPQDAWDVSGELDDSVLAWVTPLPAGMYKLFIAGEGGISAPKDCSWLFNGYVNLEIINFNNAFHTDETTNMNDMFRRCTALHTIDVSNFKTSKVEDLGWMFTVCSNLEKIDLSSFDTANVEIMEGMFCECGNIESILLGEHFNTSKVTSIYSFLWGCSKLQKIDVSGFDLSAVKYLDKMFYNCSSLEKIDVSGFKTDNAERIADMFRGCAKVKKLDLSGFNTSKITDMSRLFYGCESLEELILGEEFDTSSVENMHAMFYDCKCLTSVDVSHFNTSEVKDMSYMFAGCHSLTEIETSDFHTEKVTTMREVFCECHNLLHLDLSTFNTSRTTDMYLMFSNCPKLEEIVFGDKFDTSSVTNMSQMFYKCQSLTSLDVSGFDTRNVEDMYFMFYGCTGLSELDVSGFDTSLVTRYDNFMPDELNPNWRNMFNA